MSIKKLSLHASIRSTTSDSNLSCFIHTVCFSYRVSTYPQYLPSPGLSQEPGPLVLSLPSQFAAAGLLHSSDTNQKDLNEVPQKLPSHGRQQKIKTRAVGKNILFSICLFLV